MRKKTLANLSHLPDEIVELVRKALKGDATPAPGPAMAPLVDGGGKNLQVLAPGTAPTVMDNRFHGQVMVVLEVMRRLGLGEIISRRACP